MAATAHALLSASSAHRWLVCTAAPKLEAEFPDTTSTYAKEGTLAHEICELKLTKYITTMPRGTYTKKLNALKKHELYDPEMDETTDTYLDYVKRTALSYSVPPSIQIERRVNFSDYAPEGFGTADCLLLAGDTLHVIDYKHGLGILVSAEKNSQLSCYALGALDLFDGIYDIERITLVIYQPRRANISLYEMGKDELLAWANDILAPAAKLAQEGKGEFKAGDHCQFCKAKANCRKRAEYNLELAKYDFEVPATLEDSEVAAILPRIDDLVSWAGDVKDYALQKALSGTRFDGFKVVEGRSNRKYTDEDAVAKAVKAAGFEPYEQKLLGITAMSQVLGKKKFEELLGELVYKPAGKPVLVPDSDKRPAMNTAADDFGAASTL